MTEIKQLPVCVYFYHMIFHEISLKIQYHMVKQNQHTNMVFNILNGETRRWNCHSQTVFLVNKNWQVKPMLLKERLGKKSTWHAKYWDLISSINRQKCSEKPHLVTVDDKCIECIYTFYTTQFLWKTPSSK